MRTAIFLGAIVISFTLRPDLIIPTGLGVFVVIGLVMFIFMDVADFFRGHISF